MKQDERFEEMVRAYLKEHRGSGDSNRRYQERLAREDASDKILRVILLADFMAELANQASDCDDRIELSTYGVQAAFEAISDLLGKAHDMAKEERDRQAGAGTHAPQEKAQEAQP